MAPNIQRFKADLEKLLQLGQKLELALLVKIHGKEKLKADLKLSDEAMKGLAMLPPFNVEYEAWYSESLSVHSQYLP
jgi:hypothetical protein